MALNAAVPNRLSDILEELGGIASSRVYSEPVSGQGTIADLIRVIDDGCLCELVDGIWSKKHADGKNPSLLQR